MSALPAHSESLHIFHTFGKAGIRTKSDLDTVFCHPNIARQLLLDAGLTFSQWVLVQHNLLLRASLELLRKAPHYKRGLGDETGNPETTDSLLTGFVSPAAVKVLHDVGMQKEDLEHLARLSTTEWSAVAKYLIQHGFTFSDYLHFKRCLRSIHLEEKSSTTTPEQPATISEVVSNFVASLNGTVSSKCDLFGRIGLESEEDLDVLSNLPEEKADEVFDMFTKEGLSWSECKSVRDGLNRRAETLDTQSEGARAAEGDSS